jgi:hydroxyacylglutathione hydrolase
MRAVEQITKKIWKINSDSNVYLLDFEEPIVIDTAKRSERDTIARYLDKLKDLNEVKHVIFTHLHYDHIGNFDLFKNARFYASEKEIGCFTKDPYGTVLNEDMVKKFKIQLTPCMDMQGLRIVETPGHTKGSICVWHEAEKILFSGDTLLSGKTTGRVDLPTSDPSAMRETLIKLVGYNFRILLPGHDYQP